MLQFFVNPIIYTSPTLSLSHRDTEKQSKNIYIVQWQEICKQTLLLTVFTKYSPWPVTSHVSTPSAWDTRKQSKNIYIVKWQKICKQTLLPTVFTKYYSDLWRHILVRASEHRETQQEYSY